MAPAFAIVDSTFRYVHLVDPCGMWARNELPRGWTTYVTVCKTSDRRPLSATSLLVSLLAIDIDLHRDDGMIDQI